MVTKERRLKKMTWYFTTLFLVCLCWAITHSVTIIGRLFYKQGIPALQMWLWGIAMTGILAHFFGIY